ncbi:hypothetical protein [Terasakiella sp.]|uniref:hypothetical protein n=1 Tax=Terasakiella sp. TaxID=2034861 RepID=UPI003AA843C2
MNDNVVALYSHVRGNGELMDELSQITNEQELSTRVVLMGKELGFTISEEDALWGLTHIDEFIQEAVTGDELSDLELELVSAGSCTGYNDNP